MFTFLDIRYLVLAACSIYSANECANYLVRRIEQERDRHFWIETNSAERDRRLRRLERKVRAMEREEKKEENDIGDAYEKENGCNDEAGTDNV